MVAGEALIESFLLNIPVPPVYLAEDDFGTYSVIDGRQRIGAIRDFMGDGFPLVDLEAFGELERLRFTELPRPLGNALQVRPYIRAVTLLKQSDPDLKYEVFQRLNTGGEQLNAQEIRNVAYRGPLNDLIYELAEAPFLRRQLKIRDHRSPNYRSMVDAEYVLRFLTLAETWQTFSGDFRHSMDQFMARHQRASGDELVALRSDFLSSLEWCERLWGRDSFKRPVEGGWRDQTLAGMYDAQMVATHLTDRTALSILSEHDGAAQRLVRDLFEDEQFEISVRLGTNTPARVRYRITRLKEAIAARVL